MTFLSKTGLERLWAHIISKLNTKVDKIEGKKLSTEDYTTAEKEKLASMQGVHIGTEEPLDENVAVWIDPDGEAELIPPATTETLGGVIVGEGLNVDESGRVSAVASLPVSYTKTLAIHGDPSQISIDVPGLQEVRIEYTPANVVDLSRIQFFVNGRCCALSRKSGASSSGVPTTIRLTIYKKHDRLYAEGVVIPANQYLFIFVGTHDIQTSGLFACGVEAEPITKIRLDVLDGATLPHGTILVSGV